MDAPSPLFAIAVLLAAVATAAILVRAFGAPRGAGRYLGLDGLRGFLALFVFLHHASTWPGYARVGAWDAPDSHLYGHFGWSSVALFFMITGFLFSSKLFEARGKILDWRRLYVSRVLRVAPLYLFVVCLLFLVVGFLTGWRLRESPIALLRHVVAWLAFTIPSAPSVNALPETRIIVAGVTWTLPYEWLFYLALPVLGIGARVRPSPAYLAMSAVVLVLAAKFWPHALAPFMFFAGGIFAAWAMRYAAFRALAAGPLGAAFAVACLALLVVRYSTPYGLPQLVLLSAAFSMIAGGSSLYGVLGNPAVRLLGDISYSVYLLHGIALFTLFDLILGRDAVAHLSAVEHWLVVIGFTPFLVLLCFTTFRLLEAPALRRVPWATAWLASRTAPRSAGSGAADGVPTAR